MHRSMGTMGTGMVVSASAYDSLLHLDSRFWDVIAERRVGNMRRQEVTEGTGRVGVGSRANVEGGGGGHEVGDKDNSLLVGPTIDR